MITFKFKLTKGGGKKGALLKEKKGRKILILLLT